MLTTSLTVLAIVVLFYLLGKAADLAITHIRIIAEKLSVGIFFLGIMVGLFTSLPEFMIGINAVIRQIPTISLGNLFGGIIVLFGPILGLNIVLQRKIKSDHPIRQFSVILAFFLMPVVLGLDGRIGMIEGFIIVLLYLLLLMLLYKKQRRLITMPTIIDKKALAKHFFMFLVGVALVLVAAKLTIDLTESILNQLPLSKFVIGLIIFALGTNFPEFTIAVRAWQNNVKDLSISNLLGSAMANTLLVGIFAIISPFQIIVDNSYYILLGSMLILFALVLLFYKTGMSLKRAEGVTLLLLYFVFLALQILLEEPPVPAAAP